jgi:hypothetical protein
MITYYINSNYLHTTVIFLNLEINSRLMNKRKSAYFKKL